MSKETETLAAFAAGVSYEDILSEAEWRTRLLDRLLNLERVDNLRGLGLGAKG